MAELASRTAAGGAINDTFGTDVVLRVFADGVYGFGPKSQVGDLYDTVANMAARPPVANQQDGYRVKTTTNGLTWVVNDGAYEISEYEIQLPTVAARNALSELQEGQRVYIDALDRTDRYNGTTWVEGDSVFAVNTYSQLPDPTTVRVGVVYAVLNDPNTHLNGRHIVLGANAGSNGTYWDSV